MTNRYDHSYRSDYEDFVHDLTGQLCQNLQSKVDSYMASIVQVCTASNLLQIILNCIVINNIALCKWFDSHCFVGSEECDMNVLQIQKLKY